MIETFQVRDSDLTAAYLFIRTNIIRVKFVRAGWYIGNILNWKIHDLAVDFFSVLDPRVWAGVGIFDWSLVSAELYWGYSGIVWVV